MKYYGGKSKIGGKIAQKIIEFIGDKDFEVYFEPFCGSLGMTQHIHKLKPNLKIYASDINEDLILLYKYLQKNNLPKNINISRKKYQELKDSSEHSPLRAISGIIYSYGGGWYNGYCPGTANRSYVDEGLRSLNDMIPLIRACKFFNKTYAEFDPKGIVIYCDPPYQNSSQKYSSDFDSNTFWNTMRKWSKNNIVFISELKAPNDFKCIWSNKYISKINDGGSSERIEKLFIHKSLARA
jgi:DNA adenine methylase